MTVAKVMEITSESPESFDDAIRRGIERTSQTLENVHGAWVKEQKVVVQEGRIKSYRVDMKVTFELRGK